MALSVGFAGRGPIASDVGAFEIQAISWWWLGVWAALTVVLLGFLYRGRDMLRVPAEAPAAWAGALAAPKTAFSLARTQMAAWTVVLIWIFARAIFDTLAMPDFDATMLGLMGISGGTHVGFKKPDNKPKSDGVKQPLKRSGLPRVSFNARVQSRLAS